MIEPTSSGEEYKCVTCWRLSQQPANGTVKQPLAKNCFQFKNSIKNRCIKERTARKTPFPVLFSIWRPQKSVIAARIISSQQHPARNCSARFINAERSPWYGLKSKFPPLNPAWLLLEQCDADAVSQSRLEEGATSAHQHEGSRFLWFLVSLLIPWHLERARRLPGMCEAGSHVLWVAEVVLWSDFKSKGQLVLL